jgi:hypothetical protein
MVALPDKYINHMGWNCDTDILDWCPCPDRTGLKLVVLKKKISGD